MRLAARWGSCPPLLWVVLGLAGWRSSVVALLVARLWCPGRAAAVARRAGLRPRSALRWWHDGLRTDSGGRCPALRAAVCGRRRWVAVAVLRCGGRPRAAAVGLLVGRRGVPLRGLPAGWCWAVPAPGGASIVLGCAWLQPRYITTGKPGACNRLRDSVLSLPHQIDNFYRYYC